jgi:hypothetical protein
MNDISKSWKGKIFHFEIFRFPGDFADLSASLLFPPLGKKKRKRKWNFLEKKKFHFGINLVHSAKIFGKLAIYKTSYVEIM